MQGIHRSPRAQLAAWSLLVALLWALVARPQAVRAAASDYQFLPPHRPLSASEVVEWHVPTTGGTVPSVGNWTKYLLIVLPGTPMTGGLTAKFLQYKGVYVIGGEIDKIGSVNSTSPANVLLPGGHVMQIGFTIGAPVRPFVFIANIDFDLGTSGSLPFASYWGDFLQAGTNDTNKATWADVYLQKIKIRRGHYFFDDNISGSKDPHSDVFQAAAGGWRGLYAANMDYTWYGQGYFVVPSDISGMTDAPTDGRVILKDVVARPMGPSTHVYSGGYNTYLVHLCSYHPNLTPDTGDYYSIFLHNLHFLLQNSASGQTWPPSYFSVKGLTLGNNWTTKRVSFPYHQHSGHLFPYFDGVGASSSNPVYATYHDNYTTVPSVVYEAEVGLTKRVASATDLVNLFAPIQSTTVLTDRDTFVYDGAGTANYGSNSALVVKGVASSGANRHAYVGVNLSSLNGRIASAKLRFYAKNTTNSNPVPIGVFRTSDAWTETGITWSNAAGAPSNVSVGAIHVTGSQGSYAWYEVDVTAYVQSEYIGDQYASFLLKNTTSTGEYLEITSRETSNDPQMVIQHY